MTSKSATNWLDIQSNLNDCFEQFVFEFQLQLDFLYKTYNRYLKENIEIQLKGNKKEKQRYQQFLINEEKLLWKGFPRKNSFYHEHLQKLYEIFKQVKGVKDVSLIFTTILNILPIASQKFCSKFNIDPIFHQDSENKITFDTIAENLKMFDSDDIKNWRILGFIITILASDLISLFLDEISNKDILVASGIIDIMIEICKYFTIQQSFKDELLDEETLFDIQYNKIQMIWAKLFGSISKLAFDKCMKFMMSSLVQDFRKVKDDEFDDVANTIYFCRFISVIPVDKLMASHVQILIDNMCNVLLSKSIREDFKGALIVTLKYMIEQLNFHSESKDCDTPTDILWPVCETLYKITEKLIKKEILRDQALQLMIVIIKVCPQEFFIDKANKLIKSQKIQSYFENKKTYHNGLLYVMELLTGGPSSLLVDQDWKPKIKMDNHIIFDNKQFGIITPLKLNNLSYNIALCRKINEQIPLSFRETFKLVFNPKMFSSCGYIHFKYLLQLIYEDFDYFNSTVTNSLLSYIKQYERFDFVILALKIIDYILDPTNNFKIQYLKLNANNENAKQTLQENIESLRQYTSIVLKELLRSSLLKTDFICQLLNFFKSDEKELCNDQMQSIWSCEQSHLYKRGKTISKMLQNKGVAQCYLYKEKRQISLEDYTELQKHQNKQPIGGDEYSNDQLSSIQKSIEKEIKEWDSKKEKFIRNRIMCFLTEEKKEGQRQNTTIYTFNKSNNTKEEELKIYILIIKMIYYLPEIHDYFKFYPCKKLLFEHGALLSNRVSNMFFSDIEEIAPKVLTSHGNNYEETKTGSLGQRLGIPLNKKKSESNLQSKNSNPMLRECEILLPYNLLSVNYDIVKKTSKTLQLLMIFGNLKTRIALIDQMAYFLKELMLETTEDFLIAELFQHLLVMIKIWHQSEKNKLKISGQANSILNMEIEDLNPYEKYQENIKPDQNHKNIVDQQYIFDLLDLISLIGICNKDKMVRQFSTLLMAESGKLKRLLFRTDIYNKSLYDIFHYDQEQIKEQIIQKILIFNSFKSQEFKTKEELENVFDDLSLLQIIVDNYDYKKFGLSEQLVRDISVLLIGEIASNWKKQLLSNSEVADSILNFISILSTRTLTLFENKGEGNSFNKDYVGINLLLAITLYNISHSHIQPKSPSISEENNEEQLDESHRRQISALSTNSVIEDLQSIISLLELNFYDIYKTSFGKFYPQKFPISSIILGFLYQLQDPCELKSMENMKEMFQIERSQNNQSSYFINCLIFYVLVSQNCTEKFVSYIKKDKRLLVYFVSKLDYYNFTEQEISNVVQRKQRLILYIQYIFNMVKLIKVLNTNIALDIQNLLTPTYQIEILEFTKNEYIKIENNNYKELVWLLPLIREIWQTILQFGTIFKEVEFIKLDLNFLITLEKQGHQVLKYYRLISNTQPKNHKAKQEEDIQEFSVSDLKLLINEIFLYYKKRGKNLKDLLLQKNTFFQVFIKNIVNINTLFTHLKQKNFTQIYNQLTSSCLKSTNALIETKIKKFMSYNLQSKYFVIGLFMSLNSLDKKVIERSKILCLCVLPLMFEDEKFREIVESAITEIQDVSSIVEFGNKNFYKFIKQIFKDEESYNMKNHFERYFSLSGLLRNILNEIIKLQTLDFSQKMLLKILDIVTYFINNVQLRRAPKIDQNSFIFDNLIDYKSFEFLSKIYKISEKLVDYDDELIIMNLWYKLVEGNISNFEILSKFLIHNLSSFIMKLSKENKKDEKNYMAGQEYSIEYEKQKRYSLSIFNYIKARTTQMDIRNSINLKANSITWSQKIIQLMQSTSLNLQSKYTLEKIKLKKILQLMHSEINESGIQLQLKGGLHTTLEIVGKNNQRNSISMQALLESRTFMKAFSAKNRKESSIMKNLLFRIKRIMNEKFVEISSQQHLEQLKELIIKYFENSLVFISNDVEKPTQVINFSQKEELTIVIFVAILIIDLIISERNENRFYFLLETFNKLSIHISTIKKYFNFKQLNIQTVYIKDLKVLDKITSIINLKPTYDNFEKFTKIFFKIIQNIASIHNLHYQALKLWLHTFEKHKEIAFNATSPIQSSLKDIQLNRMQLPLPLQYSRQIILKILQSAFFTINEIAQTKKELSKEDITYIMKNFKEHFCCILSYVLPGDKNRIQQIKSYKDPESKNIAFATNAIFWLAYYCLECSSLKKLNDQIDVNEIQSIAMIAIKKVLEESDFLRMLIGIQKLSKHFYAYSLSIQKKESSLLGLIFNALENEECTEDALKALIITIKVQDYQLLSHFDQQDLSELEMQRFILLLPFLMQQFFSLIQGIKGEKSPLFNNKRHIIQLLKKSLPSIGIDKKKDVFEKLDQIQKEGEKDDEKVLRKEFEGLIQASINQCYQMGYIQLVFDCEKTLIEMKKNKDNNINKEPINLVIKIINEFIVNNELVQPKEEGWRERNSRNLIQRVYYGEILGEEVSQIPAQIRPIYFGLKNIILREIQNIDQEIDIQRFFIDEQYVSDEPVLMPTNSQISMKQQQILSPIQEQISSQQFPQYDGSFTSAVKKVGSRKQETSSKYQNSASAIKAGITPQEKIITQIYEEQNLIKANIKQKESSSFTANNRQHSGIITKQDQIGDKMKNLIFQDEEIPYKKTQTQEIPNNIELVNRQQIIVFKDDELEEDQEDDIYPNYEIKDNDFIVIQEQNQEKDVHSSSSEDPRIKLKKVIEASKNNYLQQEAVKQSPQEYYEQQQQDKNKEKIDQIQYQKHPIKQYSSIQDNNKIQEAGLNIQKKYQQQVFQSEVGGIATFSKPKNQDQQQTQRVIPSQISSISRPTDIAVNPNFVAERASKLFSDLSQSQSHKDSNQEQSIVFNDQWRQQMQQNEKQKQLLTQKYPWLQQSDEEEFKQGQHKQSYQSQKLSKQAAFQQNTNHKAESFIESLKKEDLPTPKRSNKLDSRIIRYINDKEKFVQLEKFLVQKKSYDVDLLHFYVKVMEFKRENNVDKARLAAGIIIDKYLTEDAEKYIQLDDFIVNNIINDYEKLCSQRNTIDFTIFDIATYKIEKDLIRFVDEFKKVNLTQ